MDKNITVPIEIADLFKDAHIDITDAVLNNVIESMREFKNLKPEEAVEIFSQKAAQIYQDTLHERMKEKMKAAIKEQLHF
ncbi:hypothetical protein [Bacillus cereus]|nr:hypothetical protein [Bacillus cereus]